MGSRLSLATLDVIRKKSNKMVIFEEANWLRWQTKWTMVEVNSFD